MARFRRSRSTDGNHCVPLDRIRRASVTLLRGRYVSSSSWIQELNATFDKLYEMNSNTTFADALRAYADDLEGVVSQPSSTQ